MPRGERYHDPMRELDLLLLEELMMRRDLQPTRTATVLQTLSMLLVLLGVGAIFVYALRHPSTGTAATFPAQGPEQRALTGAPRSMILW
jgi:hypothetical protein